LEYFEKSAVGLVKTILGAASDVWLLTVDKSSLGQDDVVGV
jgi:hypothetical protein